MYLPPAIWLFSLRRQRQIIASYDSTQLRYVFGVPNIASTPSASMVAQTVGWN